jgi:hypothetical protein
VATTYRRTRLADLLHHVDIERFMRDAKITQNLP